MTTLVITDIPRLAALFEQIAAERGSLMVVSEIHRGIEELERIKPGLIIIQNHLSGLSADIVHKHLKSRLGKRKARFALISPSETLEVELSARFEAILDPALSDEQLEQLITSLLTRPDTSQAKEIKPVSSILELPLPMVDEAALPDLQPPNELTAATDTSSHPEQPDTLLLPELAASRVPEAEALPDPGTYARPRLPNRSIISAFSQHLETTADELQPRPAPFADRAEELAIRDLHHEPHLPQTDQQPAPLFRRTGFWLVTGTVALVVLITLFQQSPRSTKKEVSTPQPPLTVQRPAEAPPTAQQPVASNQPALQSHGGGRPRSLPSFIPQSGIDPAYSKDNPGWSSYHGQTNEYRVFREKDGTIKAVQVIDRSGAGVQDGFYVTVLKELAGVTSMHPTSSEIKEGYEIRRGTVAGLDLVQYRDAQGGRLRGFVVTWP